MNKILLILLAILITGTTQAKDSNEIVYPDFFPEYSWDKVPVYAHFGTHEKLTDEQYALISKYAIVCFEKYTGHLVYGGSDIAVVEIAGKLKELNPKIFTMTYLSFHNDYGRFYSQRYSILDDEYNPHWAAKDGKGRYICMKGSDIRQYNKISKEVRDWWIANVEKWSTKENIDGIFIDSYSTLRDVKMARYEKSLGPVEYKKFQEGIVALRNELKKNISSKRVVIGNGVGVTTSENSNDLKWLETVSGGMMDHFAFLSGDTPENIAASIERISQIGKMGKMVMVKAWPTINHKTPNFRKMPKSVTDANALQSITFPLACFLCGAEKYAYICYSSAWDITNGFDVDYPEFNKPLGEPKGSYSRNGFEFSREFEHVSVWVNTQTKEARLDWK